MGEGPQGSEERRHRRGHRRRTTRRARCRRPAAPGHPRAGHRLRRHRWPTSTTRSRCSPRSPRPFHVSEGSAELVVTLTQLGYALGLILVLPLGDLLENRALASRTLLVTAAALVAAGLAPGYGLFLAMSVLVGATSVVAQILVPLAAHLAPERDRGRYRRHGDDRAAARHPAGPDRSSLVAAAWGWRTIYLVSSVLMLGALGGAGAMLPRHARPLRRYRDLLASIVPAGPRGAGAAPPGGVPGHDVRRLQLLSGPRSPSS